MHTCALPYGNAGSQGICVEHGCCQFSKWLCPLTSHCFSFTNTWCVSSELQPLLNESWLPLMALSCISLMISESKHLSFTGMNWLLLWSSYSSLLHTFLLGCLLLICRSSLHMLDTSLLSITRLANILYSAFAFLLF